MGVSMATVTLYEYDGETRTESSVAVNWREVLVLEFNQSECSFDEALSDQDEVFVGHDLDWNPIGKTTDGRYFSECHDDDRPLYRAEVKE